MKKILFFFFALLVLNAGTAKAGYEFYTNEAEFLAQLKNYGAEDFTGLQEDVFLPAGTHDLAFGNELDGELNVIVETQINADDSPAAVKGLVVAGYTYVNFNQDLQAFGFNFDFLGTGKFKFDIFDNVPSPLQYEASSPGSYFYGVLGREAGELLIQPTFAFTEGSPTVIIEDFYAAASDEVEPEYVSAVPVPAAIWLLGSGLAGLVGFGGRLRRR